jgi:small subunit ribosomal protein S18
MSDGERDFDNENDDLDDDSQDRSRGRRGPRGRSPSRFGRRQRLCQFCADNTRSLDYKQIDVLRRFMTENAKIRNRRQTGTCARHQRMVAGAIKRARQMALLPFEGEVRR